MRKGQEEAVGFVAIIVIVALVTVFFIGLSIRNAEPQAIRSASVNQFLESSSAFTSSCDLGMRDKYANMGQLIESCSRNTQTSCFDGANVCTVYSETMQTLLSKAWRPAAEGPVKGYVLNVSYDTQTENEHILALVNGSCEGNYITEETLSPDTFRGGTFVTSLQICY